MRYGAGICTIVISTKGAFGLGMRYGAGICTIVISTKGAFK